MKNLSVVFLVFCAIIFVAYSFECYVCNEKTEEDCNSKQTKMNCTGDDYTCWKANFKTDKDKTGEIRGCVPKKSCEEIKKKCDDGEEIDQGDGEKITKCDAACCVTAEGAENPCNDAILSQQTKSPAYSFECYVCNEKTEEDCNSKQTKVNCTGDDFTCWKANFKTDKDKTGEIRGCLPKKSCEETKKKCDDGEEIAQDDGDKITKCDAACCVTAPGAENPCNGAITVSANVVMMVFAALYGLNLF